MIESDHLACKLSLLPLMDAYQHLSIPTLTEQTTGDKISRSKEIPFLLLGWSEFYTFYKFH